MAFTLYLGYHAQSNEIILDDPNRNMLSGDVVKVWYGEDWKDISEIDNSGIHCVDIYAQI